MLTIIGVRFKPVGKIYYFDPLKFRVKKGDHVIVETVRGVEYGEVVFSPRKIKEEEMDTPLKGIIRPATKADDEHNRENKEKEKEAFDICLEKIKKHKLEMTLLDVEYTFDGNKIVFNFSAEGRVDFRELVKDLAMVFRTRIELRQIGVRDEFKSRGSIGMCGRDICCSRFLGEFAPVSIKMAKEQGLSLNPTKISGVCGRLMCCLRYEQESYDALLKSTPHPGSVVKTPAGRGTVDSVSLLKGKLKVKIDSSGETTLREFDKNEVKVIKRADHRRHHEPHDPELDKLED